MKSPIWSDRRMVNLFVKFWCYYAIVERVHEFKARIYTQLDRIVRGLVFGTIYSIFFLGC